MYFSLSLNSLWSLSFFTPPHPAASNPWTTSLYSYSPTCYRSLCWPFSPRLKRRRWWRRRTRTCLTVFVMINSSSRERESDEILNVREEKNGKKWTTRDEEKVAAIVPCEGSTTNKKQTKRTTKGERTRARARIAHHERLVESVEHLSFSLFSLSDEFLLSLKEVNGIQKCVV